MKTPTFLEQYNKIVTAYLKDELRPYKSCACFIGNMLNKTEEWGIGRANNFIDNCMIPSTVPEYLEIAKKSILKEANGLYTIEEICRMESNFLKNIQDYKEISSYEEKLYNAMESTLLMLKEIHESKGEIVEDYTFKKRELRTV